MANNKYMSVMDRILAEVEAQRSPRPSTPPSSAPKTQTRRSVLDEDTGNSAIDAIRSKVRRADQEVANIQKSRKNSRIFNAVESFGDFLPVFESATERVKANRDQVAADAETDIQDIIRSREAINRSGGYGKGGYGAAVERGLGNLQATGGALGIATGFGDEEDIGDIIEGRNRSKTAGARNQSEQEAYERFQAADGIIGSAKEIFSNFRLLTNVAVESLPSSAPSMVLGAVGGVVGGVATRSGKGAQTGASIGTGIGSFATEYGNTMLETFAENGVDLDDPESVKAAMADKELMSEARWRGTRRGIAVGAFDAMSVALAGRMGGTYVAKKIIGDTAKAGVARKATGLLAAGAVETVGQGTLGAAGEAAGQLAADGRITSPQDIVAEFAGEIPSGVVESVGGTAVRLGADSASSTAEDDELASALRARAEANPVTQVAGQIEGPNVGEMRDLGSVRVAGMTMTPSQVLEFAQNNQSQPRIADILSQPVSDVTKVEQVARILNEQEAARVEPEAVRRISSLVGGTNPTSQSRQFITDELTKIGDEVVAASPTLSAIRDTVASERGGKQFVGTLRGIVENYSPPAQQGETFFARPERGGEGSVVMTPDQIADEAKRERDAQEAFRLAGVRQQRFDEATGTGAQREDLRAGAPDPQAQFFLNPEVYGEALGGIAATIIGAENGMVRIQYESPTETGRDGRPVTISEEVDPAAMFDRVVRGTPRLSQELAGDVRTPRRGTGTNLNPRNSVDRTSTRALVPTQDAGLPATISPTRMTGFEANTDQLPVETQNAQENPQQDRQPDVEGIVQAPPAQQAAPTQAALPAPAVQQALPAPAAQKALPAPAPKRETPPAPKAAEPAATEEDVVVEDEEVDVDNDPRMVEHNQRFDDAVESIQDTENATEVRKLAKKLIREGVIDEDAYADIDERMKDVPLTERWDEGMSALEDAIEEQRDSLASDIEEEIYSEADEKASSNAAESTDAKQDVHNELTDAEKDVLADHYGEPEYNGAAKTRFIEDLVTAVNKGLQSVDKKIRAIVKRISLLTLSAAVVFSPMSLTGPSIPQARAQDIAYNETLHRAVPVAARGEMSAGAQRVYETMAPVATQNGKSFFIADKPNGMIHAFAANGSYMASAPSLYGKAAGDVLTEGRNEANGTEDVTDSGKVTPAGTFKLEAGKGSYTGGYVLYLVDPKTGVGVGANKAGGGAIVAVHSVYNGTASESREGRLDTDTANDNKISFGCINTAEEFFVDKVRPNIESFDGGMVFVMPDDVSQTSQLFPSKQRKGSPANPSAPSQPAIPAEDAARPTRKEPERRVGDQKDGKPEEGTKQETRYSGRTNPAAENETVAETAPADIDYDAVINDRLDKIAARGGQGRIVAARLRSLLKQNNYDTRQLYYAFQMGDVASRILPQNSKVDILFVPSMKASNANAAAASGIDVGSEAAGSYDAYEISQNGFRGLITLSLSDNLLGVARENAAHEAFHVIQDMLKVYDRPAYDALQKTFRDGMTIKDVDPSILRKLKTLTTNSEGTSVYDSLVNDFGDTPLSSLEAQAIAFGALVDAKDRGQSMKGLKASFIRIVDAVSGMVRGLGAILRKDGVATPAAIFEGFRSGKSQESLTEAAPLAGETGRTEEQYSGRKEKPPYKQPKIGKQKIKVPLLGTSTIPFLYDNGVDAVEQMGETSTTLKDTVKFIQDRARASLQQRFGRDRITGPSPETDAYLSQAIASEAEAAILKERATGNRSALDWYTGAIENAISEASSIYPMLADDDAAMALNNRLGFRNKEDARVIFTLALSITSQNMKVRDNARATVEQFDYFLENGRFDPSRLYGTKAPSISGNLRLANHMLDNVFAGSAEKFGAFLNTEFTVSELNGIAKRLSPKDGKEPFKISGEQASETVYGSAIFGPKIGNGFYQNLNRNFSPVTIDLWFMRLWGRLTGTLVGKDAAIAKQAQGLRDAIAEDNHPTAKVPDGYAEIINDVTDDEMVGVAVQMAADWERSYKALQKQGLTSKQITSQNLKPEWAFKAVALAGQLKPNDAPTSGGQRIWIRNVVKRSVEILAQNGYNVTPADLQALVWYPEKDLVNLAKEGTLEANLNVSYDTAFRELSTQRNANAETTNANAGDGTSNGNARPTASEAGVAREDGQTDSPLDQGATEEEGDKVRRTLSGESRQRLIDRGVMYSGRGAAAARRSEEQDVLFGSRIGDNISATPTQDLEPTDRAVYTPERTEQIIRDMAYSMDDKKSKGWMTFMSPDEFLGLTLSKAGRDILATMDPTKTRARKLNIEDLRNVSQPLFLSIKEAAPISNVQRQLGVTELPWQVFGHEGRHRMAAFKDAGITQIPVVLMRQDGATQLEEIADIPLAPQRGGRSDQYNSGDTSIYVGGATPISYENAGRIREMMEGEGIRFSGRRGSRTSGPAALRPAPSFTADNYNFGGLEPSLSDKVIFDLQDKLIDLKRIQQSITASGRRIDDSANVYRNEELYYGRAAKRSKQFLKKELAPLIDDMKAKGVSLKMLDEFLHARHAKERNAQIAKINDQMPDGGSGLTNAQVDSYLNGLPNARRRQLENLANRVDSIIANTQKMMVEYGLETQETVDTWNKTYQSYVPLQREGFEEEGSAEGSGMSVRGGSSRRALGSSLSVVDILANVAMQRERVISRGERNRIGNSLVAMALQNPNDSFWYVIDPKSADAAAAKQKLIDFGMTPPDAENVMGSPTQRYIDPNSGRVTYAPNSLFMNAPNVMATRINGEDKFVIFNTRNPRSKRLVESLKAVGTAQLGRGWNALGRVTRYLSAINTQYNPAFGLYNLMRDLQGAALNLSTTPLAGKQKSVIANALPATIGMYRDLRAERGGKTASTNWATLAEEFENEGGKTGYRDLFTSSTERADAIENELTGGSKLRQVATKTGGPVLNWLSDFNESIENGVRLSAYKEGLDMGLSKAEAASVAKNLTVNFNRKGAVTAQAGVLYAFFNAAVQGTARLGETLTGPAGKKIVMGGLMLGVAQAIALAAAGLEDEPEWLKDKNFIIPLGGGKYVAFPMPLGFHAIPSMSRRAVEFMMSDKSVGSQTVGLLGMFADAFNPIGNAGLSAQTIAPTFADPLVALGENRDFAGREIYREDFNKLDPTSGPSRNREGVSAVGAAISTAIDYMSGGNGYTAGAVSWTGDTFDYIIGQATGGVGRLALNTMSTAEAAVTGEDLPNYKIPIVGRMIGDANEAAAVSKRFYAGITEMNGHKRTVEGMEDNGKDTTSYFKQYPEADFYQDAQKYESDLSKLNKERRLLKEEGAPKAEIDAITEERQMLMNEFNQIVADYKRK